MWNRLRAFADQYPLRTVLLLALILRIVAAVFAKGYLMHDDHFLTVEPAASWAVGHNFNDWLPGIGNDRTSPEPISFFYLGFLSGFFRLLHLAGIHSPDTQMLCVRMLHGLLSLVTIYYAFKLTALISNKKNAFQAGIQEGPAVVGEDNDGSARGGVRRHAGRRAGRRPAGAARGRVRGRG